MTIKIKRLLLPIHPVLFAVFPVITLLAHNVSQLWVRDTFRTLFLSILLALVLIGLFRLIFRNWRIAGLTASFALILMLTFDPVYTFLRSVPYVRSLLAHYTVLI